MTAALKAVPLWLWLAMAAAGVIWWQHGQIQSSRAEQQESARIAAAAEARSDSLRNTLALQRELQNDQEKVVADARTKAETDRTNAAGAGALVDGLRKQVRDLQRAAEHSAPAGRGNTAGQIQGVLAGLLDESLDRNKILAAEAERYRTAGMTCQALYQSLAGRLQVSDSRKEN